MGRIKWTIGGSDRPTEDFMPLSRFISELQLKEQYLKPTASLPNSYQQGVHLSQAVVPGNFRNTLTAMSKKCFNSQ
jgi:hypothetical protein